MGFLRRLFGGSQPTTVTASLVSPGREDAVLEVVGEASYQDALMAIGGGRTPDGPANPGGHIALLWPEPKNRYDPNAISVRVGGRVVGYLSRELAVVYGPVCRLAQSRGNYVAAAGRLTGGWDRGPRDRGSIGIVLHLGSPFETMVDLLEDHEKPRFAPDHPWRGQLIAFTGDSRCSWQGWPIDREGAVAMAREAGIEVHPRVTKKVQLLVDCDPATVSGNETKASTYGIPVVTEREFWAALGLVVSVSLRDRTLAGHLPA